MNNLSSSDSESVIIDTIKNYVLASWGLIYMVVGRIGTTLNIMLFTRRALWPRSPCIPYLFASAIATIPLMYVTILSRIGIGFQVTPFYYISILCKLQIYISNISVSLIIWFMVGSCWDRYLSTSRNALTRHMSCVRNTRRTILVIVICISLVYGQVFYCFEGGRTSGAPCSAKNSPCSVIDTTVLFFIQFITPLLLIFYFGISIVSNVRHLKHQSRIATTSDTQHTKTRKTREADRIILRMLLIQVTLLFICSLPVFVFRIYTTMTMTMFKSNTRRAVENLIFNATLMVYYAEKICSFYIYTMASRHFRNMLWQYIYKIRAPRTVAPQN